MDLTRDIIYRGFTLNDENIQSTVTSDRSSGSGISGCIVDTVDVSDADVVQYRDLKAQQEGLDTTEPATASRRIHMSGTLYAPTRLALYDQLQDLRAALSPRLAWLDEPADMGFQPLFFSVPTANTTDWPTGAIDMQAYAMPQRLRHVIVRDRTGGTDDDYALAIQWDATFFMRDPRFYADAPYLNGFTTTESGTLTNRGNYPSDLNILITTTTAASGSFTFALGGANFTITIPASSYATRYFRYKGADRILTMEENDQEELRMDLLTISGSGDHPSIMPGDSPYAITKSGTVGIAGSGATQMWYWEAFA